MFESCRAHGSPPEPFRLVAWNCRLGVDRKRAAFDRLGADVLVVPECPRSTSFSRELGVSSAWRGRYDSKGLGVFALNGWHGARPRRRAGADAPLDRSRRPAVRLPLRLRLRVEGARAARRGRRRRQRVRLGRERALRPLPGDGGLRRGGDERAARLITAPCGLAPPARHGRARPSGRAGARPCRGAPPRGAPGSRSPATSRRARRAPPG